MKTSKIILNIQIIQTLSIIVALTFAVRASNNILQTTIPLLAKYNLSYAQIDVGILVAIMSAAGFIATILNSRIRAHYRKYIFIIFSIIYTLSLFLFSLSNGFSIIVYAVLSGLAYGFMFPNIMTSAGLFEDKNIRERVLGIYTLALAISLIVGPALESLVLAHYSLRSSFLFFVPLGIISVVLSPFIKYPEEFAVRKKISVWSNPGFKIGIYTFLVYSMSTAILLSFGGIFAKSSYDASYSLITLLFALFFTASFVTRLLFSMYKIGRLLPYVLMMMTISIFGLTLIFFSNNIIIYAVAFVILGVPHGLGMPIAMFSINRSFPMNERNRANSYFTSTMMLMLIVMPLLGGTVLQFIGFRFLLLYMVPAVVVLLVLSLMIVNRKEL
ncbi:MAG: MFS transporter [Thermoplasmata archaeon]